MTINNVYSIESLYDWDELYIDERPNDYADEIEDNEEDNINNN